MKDARICFLFSLLAFLWLSSSLFAQRFPNEGDFNGLSITYEVNGVQLSAPTDAWSFTTRRSYTGSPVGTTIRISGTVSAMWGYGGNASASLNFGSANKQWSKAIAKGTSEKFDLTVTIAEFKEGISGSFNISVTGHYNAGDRTLIVSCELKKSGGTVGTVETTGQPTKKTAKPPCSEALALYTKAQLAQVYKNGRIGNSMYYTRDELMGQMKDAVNNYLDEGGEVDMIEIGKPAEILLHTFFSSREVTGAEEKTVAFAKLLSQKTGKKLTPGQFFYCALKASNGSFYKALVTSHSTLFRSRGAGSNAPVAKFINDYLEPLTNVDSFNDTDHVVPTRGGKKTSFRNALNDQQGHWYHMFGTAAIEYQKSRGVSFGASTLELELIADWKLMLNREYHSLNLPGRVGSDLSRLAIALENQWRIENNRRVPDPEKQCYNFHGVAIGLMFKELHEQIIQQNVRNYPAKLKQSIKNYLDNLPDVNPLSEDAYRFPKKGVQLTTISLSSPASLTVTGLNGQTVKFFQQERRFEGNTNLYASTLIDERDKTMGLVMTVLFPVKAVEAVCVARGKVTVSVYDHLLQKYLTRSQDAFPGDQLRIVENQVREYGEKVKPTGPVGTGVTAPKAAVIFTNTNAYGVQNMPTAATTFTLRNTYRITEIKTYHWNYGKGSRVGLIRLLDGKLNVVGTWNAAGAVGQGGVPNAYWVVRPSNLVLRPGSYTIVDSNPATFSQNSASKGAGMIWVTGFLITN